MKRSSLHRRAPIRRTGIRRVSPKRAKQNRDYTKLRREFLIQHPVCELFCKVEGFFVKSNQVHHVRGRSGALLCDTRYWLAGCSDCHPRRVHETQVAQARLLGFLA